MAYASQKCSMGVHIISCASIALETVIFTCFLTALFSILQFSLSIRNIGSSLTMTLQTLILEAFRDTLLEGSWMFFFYALNLDVSVVMVFSGTCQSTDVAQ